MLQIKKFGGSVKEILPLADIYMRSYNGLSKNYKSSAEMALYTKGHFIKKLKTWAVNQQQGKEPFIFVLYHNDAPCGIMRLNEIPTDYRKIDRQMTAAENEHGLLDGWTISRQRKIHYVRYPRYDDNTLILNQIYLAPEAQKKGFGTAFIKQVIPLLQQKGYDQFIVEYNDNNFNGKKFHEDVLCAEKIAVTTDFDHVISDHDGTKFCISPVTIGMGRFSTVLKNIEAKEKIFQTKGRQSR